MSVQMPRKRMVQSLRGALACAGLALASGCAQGGAARPENAQSHLSPVAAFQQNEERLFALTYRLASANAAYCDETVPELGLLLHDAQAYGAPDAVMSTLGMSGPIGVQAIAKGSPADAAGIRQNHTLVSVNDRAVDSLPFRPDRPWSRLADIRTLIATSARDGPVRLTLADPERLNFEATVEASEACRSQIELVAGDDGASADGERILIGDQFPGLRYADDELAAVIAHEMAHNILGHIQYLEVAGRNEGRGRASERDADRLMPWLLHNAGLSPQAGADMIRRHGPRHGGGIFRNRSHDGWDERADLVEREIVKIAALKRPQGDDRLDWRDHFEPLLDTKSSLASHR